MHIDLFYFVMRIIILILSLICSSLWASTIPVTLADTNVIIEKTENGEGKHFIHLHHNETTALKAARAVVKEQGGSVITLVHRGARTIVFHVDGRRYEFDPNRIFTDRGITKTLNLYSQDFPKAHQLVKKLAAKIVAVIPPGKIIAVHNNKSYSLKDYLKGQPLHSDVEAINYVDKAHYRNFLLVTKREDFQRLQAKGFNEVLQANNAEDDGSLSVLMSQRDYINVEAGYDQLLAQIKMLKAA